MSDQVKYTQKLQGAKILITGGSAGIGYGVAEACLENGCNVTISSSNDTRVQQAVAKLSAAYPSAAAQNRIRGFACNLGEEKTLEAEVKRLLELVGNGIDHVVHTAGDGLATMKLEGIEMEGVKKAGMVRFFAPLFLGKLAPKYMNPGPASSIIITTGSVSERPLPDWTVVNSYATGLQGMVRGMALDLKPLRINLVSPGVVDTELWKDMPEDVKRGMFAEMEKKIPVGKVGQVVDVAESYLYLMKDRNVSGAMVSTSGGHLLV
ncbi:Short-chain dehydrogenase/reductase [Sphaerulina musiva]